MSEIQCSHCYRILTKRVPAATKDGYFYFCDCGNVKRIWSESK